MQNAMPKGMQMLLKSMGFDAENLMKGFTEAAEAFNKTVLHFNSRFDRLEARLTEIEKKLGISQSNVVQLEHRKEGTDG